MEFFILVLGLALILSGFGFFLNSLDCGRSVELCRVSARGNSCIRRRDFVAVRNLRGCSELLPVILHRRRPNPSRVPSPAAAEQLRGNEDSQF
ncbi:MAG: hypothetical protein KF851_06355 [Pirellulaceae bacterium]|nr:hypothetical protein [Pirellulaceae bacterium]